MEMTTTLNRSTCMGWLGILQPRVVLSRIMQSYSSSAGIEHYGRSIYSYCSKIKSTF
jgi:hypothetical protein